MTRMLFRGAETTKYSGGAMPGVEYGIMGFINNLISHFGLFGDATTHPDDH